MPINVESAKASRRPASFVDALRLVVPASPSKFGTAFTFSPKMRLSLKLRPRAEGVDDHGRSGPSNEAASSIVSTGLMTRKTHTVGRVTLISPLPFLFPCASGSNVGNEAPDEADPRETHVRAAALAVAIPQSAYIDAFSRAIASW
jgi:hypothetical protein